MDGVFYLTLHHEDNCHRGAYSAPWATDGILRPAYRSEALPRERAVKRARQGEVPAPQRRETVAYAAHFLEASRIPNTLTKFKIIIHRSSPHARWRAQQREEQGFGYFDLPGPARHSRSRLPDKYTRKRRNRWNSRHRSTRRYR